MGKKHRERSRLLALANQQQKPPLLPPAPDPSTLAEIPESFQGLRDFFGTFRELNPFAFRNETFLRIEKVTGIPLIAYVTRLYNISQGTSPYIDDSDLVGFSDMINTVPGNQVDIFLISNGGSAEATERIVGMLRNKFSKVRFMIPSNAFSAATLMCFSGDEILMTSGGSLGPIDPQINGVPARAILRAFETIEEKLKKEGAQALGAYLPLIQKYDLHILEICKSSQELSVELARRWLSKYMLNCNEDNEAIQKAVEYFSSYDIHKSHGRSIDLTKVQELGLRARDAEGIPGLGPLVRSLHNQYDLWFDKTPFYKMFEDARGTHWGRQSVTVVVQAAKTPGQSSSP